MSAGSLTALAPGEPRPVSRAELATAAGTPPPDVSQSEYVEAWLRHHGLTTAAKGDDATVVSLTPRYALQGAAGLCLAAAAVAFAGRPLYGVVTLGLGALGCGALALAWTRVAGRAPERVPRGRILGALAVVPVLLVALVVVEVLRQQHIDDAATAAAVRDVRDANTALDEHRPDVAIRLLARAEGEDRDVAGLQITRSRLVISQSSGRIAALQAQVRRLQAELARRR